MFEKDKNGGERRRAIIYGNLTQIGSIKTIINGKLFDPFEIIRSKISTGRET